MTTWTTCSTLKRISFNFQTLFVVAVTAILFPSIVNAQTEAIPPFVRDSLDNYVNRALEEWHIPGIAVCVVKNGKAVVMKGYGVRELGLPEKVDENTLFMIGSNTKAFTATSLAMLEVDKKLSLDDKVQKWLPAFKLENRLASDEVIIRDLLCHRLGLETFQGDFTYWTSDLTREEVIQRLGVIKAPYGFRTRWGYTNAAFLTAGEIIPKVTGKPWEVFVRESLFVPLRMNRTLALARDITGASNAARAHSTVEGKTVRIPYGSIDNLAPAGSISSSISDMSHWLMAQLDSGRYEGIRVFPQSVLQTTRTPHSIIGLRGGTRFTPGHFTLYGLGWELGEYGGKLRVSHTGGVNGFVTSVTLFPEEKVGILVFTNTDQNSFFEALKYELSDAYLGRPYRNYDSILMMFNRKDIEEKSIWLKGKRDTVAMHLAASVPLPEFSGEYQNEVYGRMNISVEKQALTMHFQHHTMSGHLEPLGGNRFLCTYADPEMGIKEIPFRIENGVVRSVTVRVDDFVEFTPYEFTKMK